MSLNLVDLAPAFRPLAEQLLLACHRKGYEMRPFYTLRTPQEQSALWRQSRTKAQVDERIKGLRAAGCNFLADCIENAGARSGKWATNAIGGLSWHNHGLAIDCFLVGKNGGAVWESSHPAYKAYADEAAAMGLTAGFFWRKKDAVHVQMPTINDPSKQFTLITINDMMRERFGSASKT